MPKIFRVIRKKKNLNRLRAAGLFVIILIEIFAHAQKGAQAFVAELSLTGSAVCTVDDNGESQTGENGKISCQQRQEENQPTYGDEDVSHHQVLIAQYFFNIQPVSILTERIAFRFGDARYKSLAPPYHPPEIS